MSTARMHRPRHRNGPFFTLTANAGAGGTVSGGGTYHADTTAYVTATANSGFVFSGWTGDGTGSGNVRTVLMDGNKTVTALFAAAGSGGTTIPHTGQVLYQDLCSASDPTSTGLWDNVVSCYSDQSLWTPGDLQITRETSSPDPHTKVEGGTSSGYRRVRVSECYINGNQSLPASTLNVTFDSNFPIPSSGTASINGVKAFTYTGTTGTSLTGCTAVSGFTGTAINGERVAIQSLFDASVPNSSYRTQIFHLNQHQFAYGDHNIIYFSARCQNPTPLLADTVSGSTQFCQFKLFGSGGTGPVVVIREGATKFLLRQQPFPGPTSVTLGEWSKVSGHQGDWIRYALDVKFARQADGGYIQVWADLDGSGTLVALTGQLSCDTGYVGSHARFSCGLYSNLQVPASYRDYANFEVCGYV